MFGTRVSLMKSENREREGLRTSGRDKEVEKEKEEWMGLDLAEIHRKVKTIDRKSVV